MSMDIRATEMEGPWNESTESIVNMGKRLEQLRGLYKRSEMDAFSKKVFADYGIQASSIGKLIKISQHPILSDPENADKLPPSWAILYEMKFLPNELLLEKIRSGELKTASKYKIWEWRGVKTKDPDGGPKKSGYTGPHIRVPENVSLVAYVNAGMNKESEFNDDLDAVAKMLGIGSYTYRQIRSIIMLSKHPDLSNTDSALVQSAIDKINKTRNVREHYLKVKPLIDKVWGARLGKGITSKLSQKRVEAYLHSVFLLGVAAQRLSDIDRPYMSIEDTDKAIGELSEAGTIIRKLAETLRRSKND